MALLHSFAERYHRLFPPRLAIRPATRADLDALEALVEDTRRWVQQRWPAQWRTPFARETLAAYIARGEIYVARQRGRLIGTFRLLASDPDFWSDDDSPGANYLHLLIVRRELAGRGYGPRLLRWAENEAAARGKGWLRLDTLHDNTALLRFYRAAGYEPVGIRGVRDFRVQLFQKALTPRR